MDTHQITSRYLCASDLTRKQVTLYATREEFKVKCRYTNGPEEEHHLLGKEMIVPWKAIKSLALDVYKSDLKVQFSDLFEFGSKFVDKIVLQFAEIDKFIGQLKAAKIVLKSKAKSTMITLVYIPLASLNSKDDSTTGITATRKDWVNFE